jgi:hypothetical protein
LTFAQERTIMPARTGAVLLLSRSSWRPGWRENFQHGEVVPKAEKQQDKNMNSKKLTHIIALVLFATLALPLQLAAQAQERAAGMETQVSPVSDITRPPFFWVSATPFTPSPVNPGGSSTSSATAGYGTNGVGTATLTCSVQPSPPLAPTCSISPTSVAFGAPATLTVRTFGPSSRLLSRPGSALFYALWLPLIGLVATGVGLGSHQKGQKRKRKTAALAYALLAGLSFQLACGGHGSSGTPSGTYTISVIGTAFIPVNDAVTSATLTVQ